MSYDADLTKDALELLKLHRECELLDVDIERRGAEAALKSREVEQTFAQAGEQGEFLFYADVTYSSVLTCIKMLDNWSRRYVGEPISLTFDSPGGSVFDGLHLYDFIQDLRRRGHRVTTRTQGMAASMGGILLQAGDHRTISRNGFILIHEVSTRAGGKLTDLEDETALIKRLQEKCISILASKSTMTVATITKRMCRRDWWLDAEESLRLGFVDEVEG